VVKMFCFCETWLGGYDRHCCKFVNRTLDLFELEKSCNLIEPLVLVFERSAAGSSLEKIGPQDLKPVLGKISYVISPAKFQGK
jgi:hypothetical protein